MLNLHSLLTTDLTKEVSHVGQLNLGQALQETDAAADLVDTSFLQLMTQDSVDAPIQKDAIVLFLDPRSLLSEQNFSDFLPEKPNQSPELLPQIDVPTSPEDIALAGLDHEALSNNLLLPKPAPPEPVGILASDHADRTQDDSTSLKPGLVETVRFSPEGSHKHGQLRSTNPDTARLSNVVLPSQPSDAADGLPPEAHRTRLPEQEQTGGEHAPRLPPEEPAGLAHSAMQSLEQGDSSEGGPRVSGITQDPSLPVKADEGIDAPSFAKLQSSELNTERKSAIESVNSTPAAPSRPVSVDERTVVPAPPAQALPIQSVVMAADEQFVQRPLPQPSWAERHMTNRYTAPVSAYNTPVKQAAQPNLPEFVAPVVTATSPALSTDQPELGLAASFKAGADAPALVAMPPAQTVSPLAPVTHPSTAPTHAAVQVQIRESIQSASSNDIEIRLEPEELGKLRILLSPRESGLQVLVLADRPETLDLMRRNAGDLEGYLSEDGYEGATIEFGSYSDNDDPRHEADTLIEMPWSMEPGSSIETQLYDTGGLDIRL